MLAIKHHISILWEGCTWMIKNGKLHNYFICLLQCSKCITIPFAFLVEKRKLLFITISSITLEQGWIQRQVETIPSVSQMPNFKHTHLIYDTQVACIFSVTMFWWNLIQRKSLKPRVLAYKPLSNSLTLGLSLCRVIDQLNDYSWTD